MNYRNAEYGPLVLRITLGLMFLVMGVSKFKAPAGITGMLAGLGFPAAGFFAWVLILSEITFGLALLIGWRFDIAIWPLLIILVVAIFKVVLPNFDVADTSTVVNLFWHLLGVSALISLYLTGPGTKSM